MMDRLQEFESILKEPTPPALEQSVRRAKAKYRNSKVGRWCGIPVASFAGVAAAFILLVNTSIPFARACGGVPILKELAATVAFSPSLKAAVENDYVQPVGESQTVNGVTMTVEYVIVDQKQVNIFFSLKSDQYSDFNGEPDIRQVSGERFESISYGGGLPEKGETLRCITVDFIDNSVPDALLLDYSLVADNLGNTVHAPAPSASTEDWDDVMEREEPNYTAEFSFHLTFDSAFTETGETVELDRWITLDGQRLHILRAEIYPSHFRLDVAGDSENTAELNALYFTLTDENGKEYDRIKNGISATGASDGSMTSFRMESSYFGGAKHLTVAITGAQWLDKDRAFVPVDLKNGVALAPMPEGVTLGKVERAEGGKHVRMTLFAEMGGEGGSVPVPTDSYSVASWEYRDPEGGEHRFNSMSHTGGWHVTDERPGVDGVPEGCFTEEFVIPDYPWENVELGMHFSRYSTFDTPVEIPVK